MVMTMNLVIITKDENNNVDVGNDQDQDDHV